MVCQQLFRCVHVAVTSLQFTAWELNHGNLTWVATLLVDRHVGGGGGGIPGNDTCRTRTPLTGSTTNHASTCTSLGGGGDMPGNEADRTRMQDDKQGVQLTI